MRHLAWISLLVAAAMLVLMLLRCDPGSTMAPLSGGSSIAAKPPDRAAPPVAEDEALTRELAPAGGASVAVRPMVRVVATLPGGAPAALAVVRCGPWEQHPFSRATAAEDREAWLADNGTTVIADDQAVHESTLVLAPGENVWPKAGALDLRRAVRAFHVGITADDGSSVERPQGFAVPIGSAAPPEGFDPRTIRLERADWFVPRQHAVELVVAATGFVPVRISEPTADSAVRLVRCTTLRVHTAQGEETNTIVRVVEDPVRDPWLRTLDTGNLHGTDTNTAQDEPVDYFCVPGTVVEIIVERNGAPGTAQRVVIGSTTVECTAR